jgi:hypothetical protein
MFQGDDSVRRSPLALLKQEVNLFMKHDGEITEEVYRRFNSLVLDLRNVGCTWTNENFIKVKFIGAMVLMDHAMVMMIHQRLNYDRITPNQVVSTFTTHTLYSKPSPKS